MLLGLLLSVLVGVTFFVLMETSIRNGFSAAISMSLGIVLSDAIILFSIWYISKGLIETIVHNSYFNMLCSLIFLGFGSYYLLNSKSIELTNSKQNYKKTKSFFQGMAVNILNPSVTLFWLASMLIAISKLALSNKELLVYFASALAVVLLTDVLKIYSASKLRYYITEKHIKYIYIGIGILFFVIGLKTIISITYYNS